MKHISVSKFHILLLAAFFISGCSDEETTEPTEDSLVYETSFENNGSFSDDGWSLSATSRSSNSTPPGGGSYSLEITATDPPEVFSSIKVPVNTQYSINRLTFWSRSTSYVSGVYGKAILSQVRNGAELQSKSVLVDRIDWNMFTIQDTFSVAAGDSFLIKFSGGVNQLLSGKSYFDLVEIEGLK